MKPSHLQCRNRPARLATALLAVWLLILAATLPAAASGKDALPDWSASKPDSKTLSLSFQGGGGPTLSLLYLDVDALNALVEKANAQEEPDWQVPTFAPGQPLILWGGGGSAGGERVRFGGFGAGGKVVEENNDGTARFSLGYGGAFLHYVIRPGVEAPILPEPGNPYPNGRLRFTVGGLLGGGGYELTLTDKYDAPRDYPHHRTTSQAFVLLAPEVGVEFALTPFTHLRLAATYFYAIPVGGSKPDPAIHPDPSVVQQLAINLGLIFGIF